MTNTTTTLVILTLNEIEGTTAIFDQIPMSRIRQCLVIDGGSTDGTVTFFQDRGIEVIVQTTPGRGEAFRIAERMAQNTYLVFFSPDGNEDPRDIPLLIDKLDEGYDMIIGSRFLPGGGNEEDNLLFPWRAWANRTFTFLANTIWGGKLSDSINGFRAVRRDSFQKMKPDGAGYVIEYQLSIRAMKLGMKIAEIPTLEGKRIGGESGAPSIRTGLRFLRFLFREIAIGSKF